MNSRNIAFAPVILLPAASHFMFMAIGQSRGHQRRQGADRRAAQHGDRRNISRVHGLAPILGRSRRSSGGCWLASTSAGRCDDPKPTVPCCTNEAPGRSDTGPPSLFDIRSPAGRRLARNWPCEVRLAVAGLRARMALRVPPNEARPGRPSRNEADAIVGTPHRHSPILAPPPAPLHGPWAAGARHGQSQPAGRPSS
jgi:hypothetical protein